MRNPVKVKYLHHPTVGNFEVPKNRKSTTITSMVQQYQSRLDFEKYMNPKGLKPTITSRFVKPAKEIDFVNHEVILAKSHKPYDKNQISFRVAPHLSKPEIKQYLAKVYKLPVQRVDTFNKQGELKRDLSTAHRWKKKNWKKAIVTLDYEID